MPSNRVQINRSGNNIWEVPDSKMEEVMEVLERCGEKQPPERCSNPSVVVVPGGTHTLRNTE